MTGYQVTDLRPPNGKDPQPYCNLCHHPIVRLGMDWICTEECRCLMIGCVPATKQPDP